MPGRGFLQAVYVSDDVSVAFYNPYHADPTTPYRILQYAPDDPTQWEATQHLDDLHAELLLLPAPPLSAAAAYQRAQAPAPYTHPRAHETGTNLVCRLPLEKKKHLTGT